MKRTDLIALAERLETYANDTEAQYAAADFMRQLAEAQPAAARYDWDGDGWLYLDNGSGSDWMTRHADAEPLYTLPLED